MAKQSWFVGGPLDCMLHPTHGDSPAVHVSHMNKRRARKFMPKLYDKDILPQMEPDKTLTYIRTPVMVHGSYDGDVMDFYVLEGIDPKDPDCWDVINALLLYTADPGALEKEGLDVAHQLPREIWPDRRRPVRRLAAYTRLFIHRIYTIGKRHRILRLPDGRFVK